MPLFVIEHLEPKVYPWCILEYKHISSVVRKNNLLITKTANKKLATFAKTSKKSINELTFDTPCILDPEAKETLTPKIAATYHSFIFGGILGDYPPRKRTQEEVKLPYPRYNLGKEQMSTDTAVIVTHNIVNGTPLEKMHFQDGIEIDIKKGESIQLPYRYLLVNGKPMLPPGLVQLLKKQKGF